VYLSGFHIEFPLNCIPGLPNSEPIFRAEHPAHGHSSPTFPGIRPSYFIRNLPYPATETFPWMIQCQSQAGLTQTCESGLEYDGMRGYAWVCVAESLRRCRIWACRLTPRSQADPKESDTCCTFWVWGRGHKPPQEKKVRGIFVGVQRFACPTDS